MTISINELESGMAINLDGQIYTVTEYNHVKPGKGSAFVRVRLRNLKTQQVLERTFRSSESLDDVPLEETKLQTLYQSDDSYHFMDLGSYEEVTVSKEIIGNQARFLKENLEVTGLRLNHDILKVNLPNFVEYEVTHTDVGLKGDSTKSGGKPAVIDTGTTVQVPLFINTGDAIRIDTRTGDYIERVKR